MIELTVKTLDSQNHSFSLDDDITVRGFKEHIAESVAVPADSQRLIYCGRVLQDEKKLNDYDVNGKVIHLVQRAPPQPGQRENEGGQNQNTGQNTSHIHRTHYRIIRDPQNAHSGPNAQVHGNAMYLGAMTLPTEVVEGHGLPLPQLSNTLSNSRMVMAARMLTNANRILDRLDNPSNAASENTTERQNSSTAENSDVNMDTSQSGSGQSGSAGPVFMSQEDAFEIDTEPVRPPPPVSRTRHELKRWETLLKYATRDMLNIVGCHEIPSRAEDDPEEIEVSTSNSSQPGTASQQQPRENLLNDESNNSERPVTTPTLPRPPQMADLLQMLMNTQDRLRPYLERYRVLMATDPVLSSTGTGPESVSENQRIVDEVSRILHYIAHANHALSDIIVDMGQAPPRNLSCRPIVIQQSAILQAGIPIQVEAHFSVNERNARSNSTEENGTTQASSDAPESADRSSDRSAEFRETPAEDRPNPQNSSSSSHQRFDHQQNSDQPPRTEQQQRTQTPFGNLLSSVFNLPSNVEVLMEVSPDSSMDLNSSDDPASNNASNNNGTGANHMGRGTSGMFPWGAPPTDFIRNLMHAVAGHIVQDPSSMNSNQSSNTTSMPINQHTIGVTIDSNGQNSGQSTQARNNVGTHPTTSTQTRSTSRPHVFHSHGIGLGTVSDPFLPCNSHHLRRPSSSGAGSSRQNMASRNQSGPQATASTSSNSSHSNSPSSPRFINGDRFLDILRRGLSNKRFTPNRDAFAYTLRNFLRIVSDGKVDVRYSTEIPATVTSGITLADFMEIDSSEKDKNNLIFDLTLLMARNVRMEDVVGLRFYQYNIFASLRKPVREFIKEKTKSSGHTNEFVTLLLNHLELGLKDILFFEGNTSNKVTGGFDIKNSVESVLRQHLTELVKLFCNEEIDDATFIKKGKLVFLEMITQFCNVVRYLYAGDQSVLASVVESLIHFLAKDMHISLVRWMYSQLGPKFRVLAVQVPRLPHDRITPLLTRVSPDPRTVGACLDDVANMSKTVESLEPVDTNFPGHEILPPDWVPTIALDGARQRRLAPSMPVGGISTFSDAYLGCLPCKRRKIIQQEKPQLLVNSTSNHSTISASIERMVREGANRAGVAEVEGAAVAVANDRGVRDAFGEAIRDYVQPRRLEGPDFPNSIRFPNASKFFYEDSPPKE